MVINETALNLGHPRDVRCDRFPRDHRSDLTVLMNFMERPLFCMSPSDVGRPPMTRCDSDGRAPGDGAPAGRSCSAFGTNAAPPLIALAIALAAWEGVVALLRIPVYLLPAPSAIVETLWRLLSAGFIPPTYVGAPASGILYDTYVTYLEAGVGLLIGTTVGLLLSIVMVHSRFAEQALYRSSSPSGRRR